MTAAVFDSSALLAFLLNEPGADVVRPALGDSEISSVNYSEVVERGKAKGIDTSNLRGRFASYGLTVAPFTADDAEATAQLWAATQAYGLSLADRACLAFALARQVPVYTADRPWTRVNIGADVRMIR